MNGGTKLYFVKSKNPELITNYVRMLPYKIEIKSGPTFAKDFFYLFYILADDSKINLTDINLDE